MYGAETWVLIKATCVTSCSFERKILRTIYGPICERAIWRSRYNEELYRLYAESDLVTTVRITRFRWAGHTVCMQDNLPCKKITLDKPESRRRVGSVGTGLSVLWVAYATHSTLNPVPTLPR
jgi:hypothetical protein